MGITVDQGRDDDQSALQWLDRTGGASALLRARGTPVAGPRSASHLRLAAFGLGPDTAQGPLLRAATDRPADGRWWFRARPLHLVADLDRVHLQPEAVADLGPHEAEALAALLQVHLASEGGALEVLGPTDWLLGTARAWAVAVDDPETAARGPLEDALPRGPDARALRGLLTELQMLLHDAPVNVARAARGCASVNGVWLWGGGATLATPRHVPAAVLGDDLLLRALCDRAGVVPGPVSRPAPGWYEPAPSAAAGFATAVLRGLQRGALPAVLVHVPDLGSWRLTPRSAWQLWRRA
jgi:hypothetical protein